MILDLVLKGFLDLGLSDEYWTINQLPKQSYSLEDSPARAKLLLLKIAEFTVPIVDAP